MKVNGWDVRSLREVCSIRPPKAEARRRLTQEDHVSFLPMEDLGIDRKHPQPVQSRRLSEVEGSYTYFADGDVLLAKITPCFQNGKLGVAKGLLNGLGFGSSEFIVLRPGPELDREYLYYFLSRDEFRRDGVRSFGGSVGQQRVPPEFVMSRSLAVPPLPEQRRIVGILDAAFESIATARANTERNLENARAVFESFRASLYERKLNEWGTLTLDQIAENLDSKRIPITKSKRKPGPFPYYGASGVVDYVDGYIFDHDALLVSEDGANLLARSSPIAFSVSGKYWVNNHAHILRFKDLATQRFVEQYLESIRIDEFVTGAAQPKLNQKALNSIAVPLPATIEEQDAVVSALHTTADEVKRLEQLYRQKLAALEALKQSLLHHAFTGQL